MPANDETQVLLSDNNAHMHWKYNAPPGESPVPWGEALSKELIVYREKQMLERWIGFCLVVIGKLFSDPSIGETGRNVVDTL